MQGRSQEFATGGAGDKTGVWGRKSLSGVQGQSTVLVRVWGQSP